ncbi:MAG: late competence development ComFB family protein [Coleofasciculus sp. S288]|nr:late competence development ComFB family protein [Coleofasciculus sp. S288]
MDKNSSNQFVPYFNVMEPLVVQEVQRQLQHLPSQLVKYLNPAEVTAYALNRLPVLYATSVEGRTRQQRRAKNQIET